MDRFDEFLEQFVASAEPEVNFEFQSTRIQEVRAETRLRALQVAREKAAALAHVVGARLGQALLVEESNPNLLAGGGYGGGGGGYGGSAAPFESDVPDSTFAPGKIEVRVTIYATFELE